MAVCSLAVFAWPPPWGQRVPNCLLAARRERPLSCQGGEGRVGHVGHITRPHYQATLPGHITRPYHDQPGARQSSAEKSTKADSQKASPRALRARFWDNLLHRRPVRSPPFTSIHQLRKRQRPLVHLAPTSPPPPRIQTSRRGRPNHAPPKRGRDPSQILRTKFNIEYIILYTIYYMLCSIFYTVYNLWGQFSLLETRKPCNYSGFLIRQYNVFYSFQFN